MAEAGEHKNIKIGVLGEDIACMFLVKHNFEIICRNYRKKWGEIDIIAKKKGVLHFIEVKTLSRELDNHENVSRETFGSFQPEDSVHHLKRKRLMRAITSYISEKKISDNQLWQFDMIGIFLDEYKKIAKVRFSEDFPLQ